LNTDVAQSPPPTSSNRASSFAQRLRPSLHIRKRSKNSQITDSPDHADDGSLSPPAESRPRSLSGRLKRFSLTSRSRTTSASSINVPDDLPEIPVIDETANGGNDHDAEWEHRAALLAQHQRNRTPSAQSGISLHSSRPNSPDTLHPHQHQQPAPSTKSKSIPIEDIDAKIQEAIALHEAGELERSTAIFRTLADPDSANNAFSQLLYGLALRHGWGCALDPGLALQYHSLAASNSAAVSLPASSSSTSSSDPLTNNDAKADRTTRLAARGELVLAIYELGNAFRHGLGCTPDPVAARRYYETAAELGDVDAMTEAAWCCEHGYGGGKDKWRAARLLRMAEERGARLVGSSWVSAVCVCVCVCVCGICCVI